MARRPLAGSWVHTAGNRLTVFSATALCLITILGAFAACATGRMTTVTITAEGHQHILSEFPLSSGATPFNLLAGPDGNVWFTEDTLDGSRVARITPAGTLKEFTIPSGGSGAGNEPFTLAVGPDGALWFDQYGGSVVGRITTDGSVMEFKVPSAGSLLGSGLVTGGDGNLWFGEIGKVGRVTPTGQVTEFPIPGVVPPVGNPFTLARASSGDIWLIEVGEMIGLVSRSGSITQFSVGGQEIVSALIGPDGNLWFAQGQAIKRMTIDGHATTFPTTTAGRLSLYAGRDDALYFSDQSGQIGRITTEGTITQLATIPALTGLMTGPDGNLWFTQGQELDVVGQLTLAGAITSFKVPTANSAPSGIIVGPDGNLWFGEFHGERVGRITP